VSVFIEFDREGRTEQRYLSLFETNDKRPKGCYHSPFGAVEKSRRATENVREAVSVSCGNAHKVPVGYGRHNGVITELQVAKEKASMVRGKTLIKIVQRCTEMKLIRREVVVTIVLEIYLCLNDK
jgi:hypothetical protein